jgi:acylphosphatase
VQGVWYRASAQNEAARLSLDGWARNLADGRVEVVVSGPADAVAEFCGWLWKGPPAARVESVSVEAHEQPLRPGFDVR